MVQQEHLLTPPRPVRVLDLRKDLVHDCEDDGDDDAADDHGAFEV